MKKPPFYYVKLPTSKYVKFVFVSDSSVPMKLENVYFIRCNMSKGTVIYVNKKAKKALYNEITFGKKLYYFDGEMSEKKKNIFNKVALFIETSFMNLIYKIKRK